MYGLERIPPRWLLLGLVCMVCTFVSDVLIRHSYGLLWVAPLSFWGWWLIYRASVRRAEEKKALPAQTALRS